MQITRPMATLCRRWILLLLVFAFSFSAYCQPPVNDNCSNASVVNISGGGYGIGIFTSTTNDITSATLQTGETFAPAILVAGQSQKSMWYKFTLPTTRAVRVTLAQTGTAITAGDVGFTVYKTNGCLPQNPEISTKLTPIGLFGNSYHPCVDSAVYYVQVSAKNSAAGQVYITVETSFSPSQYDRPSQAYNFGSIPSGMKAINYAVDCQSLEDAAEVCTGLANGTEYTKTTWHVFTTPNYFDYIALYAAKQGYVNGVKFGYKIYQGDVTTTPYTSLPVVVSCDSLQPDYYYSARKIFHCGELNTNTTYTLQLFFRYDFNDNVAIALNTVGTHATNGPEPTLSGIPAPTNSLGVLPSSYYGTTTNISDFLACNARHSQHNCPLTMPVTGLYGGSNPSPYNLSSFFKFTLSSTSEVSIGGGTQFSGPPLYMRLFKQNVTNNCSNLDPVNIRGLFSPGWQQTVSCLDPGDYVLQVMGSDTISANWYGYGSLYNTTTPVISLSNLGQQLNVSITVKTQVNSSKYSLQTVSAFDSINVVGGSMQPLVLNSNYNSHMDTLGCANTVLPWDTSCAPANTKAVYREFVVNDSSILSVNGNNWLYWKLYSGDASALATAQNVNAYPQKIQGLNPISKCLTYQDCNGGTKFCLVPGTYTHVTFGGDGNILTTSQPNFQIGQANTIHGTPATAENMGDILAQVTPGNTLYSSVDRFSCRDNAIPINGYQPCTIGGQPATKVIYRQFYLSQPASVDISNSYNNSGCYYYWFYNMPYLTLFSGKITDSVGALTPMPTPWRCFNTVNNNNTCNILPAGWYTIISYGTGPTYSNPMQNVGLAGVVYSGHVDWPDQISIRVNTMCPGPKFNRPNLAAIDTTTQQPFLVQWGPRVGHTTAYPKTDTTYILPKENFNCIVDTPFTMHPITSCDPNSNRVAYWVFQTTQVSYVQINTQNLWGAVYLGNARNGTSGFNATTLIQPCIKSQGFIQLCRLQPGTYTLVVFADNYQNCTSVQPTIYIDDIGGISRFDFAQNAYDFGVVPPDSVYHFGKVGDVNPLDPGRKPSNDFIYCSTGASTTDPTEPTCGVTYNPSIYNGSVSQFNNGYQAYNGLSSRRNLWYTFVVKEGGTVRVAAGIKTINKGYNPRFAVYKSDVNGMLPFATVVANGLVDSTVAQGLSFVASNYGYPYCVASDYVATFQRDVCSPVQERYYVLVENPNTYPWDYSGLQPNSQVEVAVMVDSVNAIAPLFDHYYQANNIGTNLGPGSYTGATDNYSCATGDLTDPVYYYTSCKKTLWYKFSTTVTGKVRYAVMTPGYDQVQLFRQTIPGDSTSNGLAYIGSQGFYDGQINAYSYEACVQPGTYYLILPGCSKTNEYVWPKITITEEKGDFCSVPVVAPLNGPGTNVSSVTIDCHTIGTDYGEFNNTLTCPNGAPRSSFKTSWFRIDITGTDTLDVTTYLTENTTASSSQIKYRLMDGNCGAMQERSCVQDALTQDTYKCLPPGSYFIQVFSPAGSVGTIDLHLSAVVHADTCAPINTCLSTAVFIPQVDCNNKDYVAFTNLSTYGSGVQYQWDFGYNNQTSTAISPTFVYPFLATSQTYTVKLKVLNNGCGGQDSTAVPVTVPGRPYVNLGNDTTICAYAGSMLLNAASWPGATYEWQNGASAATYNATYNGASTPQQYWVKVSYNNCYWRDTINVAINPFQPINANSTICGNNDSVYLNANRGPAGLGYLWNTGNTNSGIYVSQGGLYTNSLSWRNCIIKDSFNVIKASTPFANTDTTICYPFQSFVLNGAVPQGSSYSWQNGTGGSTFNVTAPGTYWVQYYVGSCFKKDTLLVHANAAPVITNSTASICSGQSFTLPWGVQVSASGLYSDTTKYPQGCDSLIKKVNLTVTPVLTTATSASMCSGTSYALPWGGNTSIPGTYVDTIRTLAGCDSLIRTVNLSMSTVSLSSNNITICAGQSYALPWGTSVSQPGVYKDTLHYMLGGCDSLIRTVNLNVLPLTTTSSTVTICSGQSYMLPWGQSVTTAGIYHDTLHYALTGCDSLVTSVQVIVNPPVTQVLNASVCAGQTYLLPWGQSVNSAGTYKDTLHYVSGCDSLVKIVNLSVNPVTTSSNSIAICSGQTYLLPSGLSVAASGIYRDTLHYVAGCDSLIRVTNLTVQNLQAQNSTATICSGQSYTLPWGAVATVSGVYHDTLHYFATGCDSVQRTVTLNVLAPTSVNTNAAICSGSSYLLPWGTSVSAAGIYKDTLHYVAGCDSLIRTVNLSVNSATAQTTSAAVCGSQSYTLPWGQVANATGTYRDTLHYQATGCDSLVRIVNLSVYNTTTSSSNVSICAGQSYALPWGTSVSTAGIYKDTLHYLNGCDSLIRSVNLTVNAPTSLASSAVICQGQSYTLPWGTVVTSTGTYRDTLYYQSGCDSIHYQVNLLVKPVTVNSIASTICSNQSFTLPWGQVANASGIYRDTLHYISGCDSLISVVNLTVKSTQTNTFNPSVCSGQTYTLPWGAVVNSSGTYRDTLHYANGCDSLIRVVNLVVNSLAIKTTKDTSICQGQHYLLPWGVQVYNAGSYIDTTRATGGCDSLIRSVNLTVNPNPNVSLTKSNDINCTLGSATLTASGGFMYTWTPPGSLSNPRVANPVASPASTTTYVVIATSREGCSSLDSIRVIVLPDPGNGFDLPNAFTPNNDGLNDCFGVKTWGAVTDLKLTIYNRWGEIMFQTTDPSKCWDGNYKGKELTTAVFVYQVSANTICGKIYRKGTVTLIR